jgi:hypothetical protein
MGELGLPTEPVDSRGKGEGKRQRIGVRRLPGQGERRLAPLLGLLRIAQQPQTPGRIAEEGDHPLDSPTHKGLEAGGLGGAEGGALLQVRTGVDHLSQPEAGDPQRIVGFEEDSGVGCALSQAQEVFPQLACLLQLSPHQIDHTQPPQDHADLRGVSQLLPELQLDQRLQALRHLRVCRRA